MLTLKVSFSTSVAFVASVDQDQAAKNMQLDLQHNYLVMFLTLHVMIAFKPLPNDKFLDWSKLKELADDKINVTEKLNFVSGREENIVGKGENAVYQIFLFFPQCFQKASLSASLNGIVW